MSLILSSLFFLATSLVSNTQAAPTVFPVAGVKSISVSLPKGKVLISSSKTQKDISVNIVGPKVTDDKKCTKTVGLENAQLFVKVSSENMIFEKADCDFDITIVTPMAQFFDMDISSGSATVFVKDVNGAINLKTATGLVDIEGDVLKNIDAKTATGNMNFRYKTCSGRADLDILSATGKVAMKLPAACKIRVEYTSATGKLFNAIGESEDYQIKINAKSASGDFSITKQ
jgi:DUF4097 and DUF4098 domain-containing protein YvlB